MGKEPIVLKSAAPIPSPAAWARWGYIISFILAAITLGIGLICVVLVLLVSGMQEVFHRDKIRRMKFKFIGGVDADEIYNRLEPALTKKYGDRVEFEREGDTISVIYDSVIYDINLNDDQTFCVWWRKSIAGALLTVNESKLYKKARTGTAIVAYELQKAFEIK